MASRENIEPSVSMLMGWVLVPVAEVGADLLPSSARLQNGAAYSKPVVRSLNGDMKHVDEPTTSNLFQPFWGICSQGGAALLLLC